MNREQVALAAGHFNGEGSFLMAHPRGRGHPVVAVNQSFDPWMLEQFRRAMGGAGLIHGPYFTDGYGPKWQYTLNGVRAIEAMQLMWEFLSPLKKQQFQEAIWQHGWNGRMS